MTMMTLSACLFAATPTQQQRTLRVRALDRPHLMTVRDELLSEADEFDIDFASVVISAALLGEMG